jgi:hypothetical protein
MANSNAPFGFRPTMRTLSGGGGSIQNVCKVVGYGTALFINDAVTHAAASLLPIPAVDAAITPGTTPVAGVNLIYGAASTATNHIILLADAGAVFEVQGDGTGSYLIAATMSKNANIALTAGNTGTKVSKHELSETSLNTTNTLDLKVRGLVQNSVNVLGQYAVVYVTFNNLVGSDQKAGI